MNAKTILAIGVLIIGSLFAVIAASELFAAIFDSTATQMLSQALTWIGIIVAGTFSILNYTDTNEDDEAPAEDSSGPDVEPQSRSYSLGHDPETTDSDSDTDDSHSNSERSDTDTGRQSSLRRSNDDILDETENRLDDHITFHENGTIQLDNYDDFNMYSRMMLYVIAKRLTYEDQCVDTPQVTGADLRDQFNYTKVDLMLFLHEAGDHLTPTYRIGGRDNDIPYSEIDELEVAVDVQPLSTITDWTVNEQQTVRPFLQSQITDAIDYLDEARSRYSEMEDSDDPYSRQYRVGTIQEPVKNACKHVRQYPVEIGYDNHWKTFTRYAETLLDYLADGSLGKTEHCVPDMKRALKNMRNQAEEESRL